MSLTFASLWNQFILAAALARTARPFAERAKDDLIDFVYVDTHAGPGRYDGSLPGLQHVCDQGPSILNRAMLEAYHSGLGQGHLGSWLLAGRVLGRVGGTQMAVEMDVNDLSPAIIEQAKANREGGWVRLWSHDWFLFLRSTLNRLNLPHFVFIDPPADDHRGPAYAIDAAILLDTMSVPYMVTYPVAGCQTSIDEIGRTGLELLDHHGNGCGALLGGGAETVLLEIMGDLTRLAEALNGHFYARLPQSVDYMI